ncbi:MAG: 4-hydroxybenzoate octaprenyltransferase [Lysobacter sp.]|nr:4-hydroxybenzoate octaprenyltransferase [Lysobacter sp.]
MKLAAVAARLDAYEKLVRLDKPVGILLLLWPTLWGLWLAAGAVPDWRLLWIFFLGTVLMRSAGCALNDWADRAFDPHVERTRTRPLAAGTIHPEEAVLVAATLALAAFMLVVWSQNLLTTGLAVVAAVIAAVYPFTKRFLAVPQAWLGMCFGFGIPMAFAAQTGEVPALAWWLWTANIFWTLAYDTEYAMVDRDDDLRIGIKTSAILFGRFDLAAVAACYAIFLAMMARIGAWQGYGALYYAGLAAGAAIAAWHFRWLRDRSREGCFRAFRHNHWIGLAVLAGVVLDTQFPKAFG